MTPAQQSSVERIGGALTQAGLARLPSRVFAALLVDDDGRMTSVELAEALDVSAAGVSGAVGYLEQLGMLRRERERGSRRDVYVVDDDAWHDAMMRHDQLVRADQGLAGARPDRARPGRPRTPAALADPGVPGLPRGRVRHAGREVGAAEGRARLLILARLTTCDLGRGGVEDRLLEHPALRVGHGQPALVDDDPLAAAGRPAPRRPPRGRRRSPRAARRSPRSRAAWSAAAS